MSVLSRYLTRLFMTRFWGLLLGLAALVIILDLLSHGDELIRTETSILQPFLRYMGLRTPEILTQLFPFAVLLAALLTLMGLIRASEMAALLAAGVSQARLMIALVPAAVSIAAVQVVIEHQVLPSAVRELRAWGVGDYDLEMARDKRGSTWLRQGRDVIRMALGNGGDQLPGMTIFRRDEKGNLIERIDARGATFDSGSWTLEEVTRAQIDTGDSMRIDRMLWDTDFNREELHLLTAHPREMSLATLTRLVAMAEFGTQPRYLYELWLQKKIERPAVTVLMILLSVPLVQHFHRRVGFGWMLAAGVGLGFLYWIFDGLLLSTGEAGLLPPLLAAWTPALVFTAIGLSIAVWNEQRRGFSGK